MQNFRLVMCYDAFVLYVPRKWSKSNPTICSFVGKKNDIKGGNVGKQKELVAYHEAGHAIVGALVPDYDQVQKISIIPRSNGAGGLTFFAPQESRLESGLYSKQYLESQLAVALGGRLAEELAYGQDMVTTGASNDIQQVASIAKRMVKEWGMSDKVGRVVLSDQSGGGSFWVDTSTLVSIK